MSLKALDALKSAKYGNKHCGPLANMKTASVAIQELFTETGVGGVLLHIGLCPLCSFTNFLFRLFSIGTAEKLPHIDHTKRLPQIHGRKLPNEIEYVIAGNR